MTSWDGFVSNHFRISSDHKVPPPSPDTSLFDLWLASRQIPGKNDQQLVAGAQRPLNIANLQLAYVVLRDCAWDMFHCLWVCHPTRLTLLLSLNLVRSLFPAFRGYSQALIIDEIQSLFASGVYTWPRLLTLLGTEVTRRVLEGLLDSFASSNEALIMGTAKFYVERNQLQLRVRLDAPTLSDPLVRDLLQESDLFTRSFCGGGFGFISPLDFFQVFSILAELVSHLFLIASLTKHSGEFGALLLSLLSVTLPLILPWLGLSFPQTELLYGGAVAQAAQKKEKMRSLAYSDVHRPEIALFGLGDWIVQSWSIAWKSVFYAEQKHTPSGLSCLTELNFTDLFSMIQNLPLILLLRTSQTSLGSLTLYRSSIQSVASCIRSLLATTRMTFQTVFLMLAFSASKKLKPKLSPHDDDRQEYRSISGGIRICARGLSYTYPGSTEPALHNVSFDLDSGETLAIVGFNGSGKSTLSKVLLRMLDFDAGELFINEVDIRRLDPKEYHQHLTSVLQDFSKFNLTLSHNVGFGNIQKMPSNLAICNAVRLAEADGIVDSLPYGLDTPLESPGYETISFGAEKTHRQSHHGLSGGEWQRVAIARAFMRASEPEIDLLVFDEPTSSLDACAQNRIFDTIHEISHTPTGERKKTVIFITHRLSTARRADKVAMMEKGTITEFGSHSDLMRLNGAYATLYNQSV